MACRAARKGCWPPPSLLQRGGRLCTNRRTKRTQCGKNSPPGPEPRLLQSRYACPDRTSFATSTRHTSRPRLLSLLVAASISDRRSVGRGSAASSPGKQLETLVPSHQHHYGFHFSSRLQNPSPSHETETRLVSLQKTLQQRGSLRPSRLSLPALEGDRKAAHHRHRGSALSRIRFQHSQQGLALRLPQ